jgi:Predicted transcriptional regulators
LLSEIDSILLYIEYNNGEVSHMSIGKTLSNLRKQKGISQEELATFLHVSRQTISKWEADLSLPNMEMILQLSEYYEIPVTRLLGIEEDQKVTNESVERLYEQTSVVLENIRKENKKRQTRDVILIVTSIVSICLVLALSFIVLTKDNKPPVINNYENKVEYTEPSIIKECNIKENKIDLTKRIVQSHYEVELSSFTKETSVQLIMIDTDKKKYQYRMKHDLEGKFTFDKDIPLKDYLKTYIDIDDGKGNLKKEDLEEKNFYFTNALSRSLQILVKLKQDKLDMSTIYIEPNNTGFWYDENEFTYTGAFNGNAIIHLKDLDSKDDQGNYEVILDVKQPLDQKKEYHLKENLSYNHELSYVIEIEIDGKKYEVYNDSIVIQRQYSFIHNIEFLDYEAIDYETIEYN